VEPGWWEIPDLVSEVAHAEGAETATTRRDGSSSSGTEPSAAPDFSQQLQHTIPNQTVCQR